MPAIKSMEHRTDDRPWSLHLSVGIGRYAKAIRRTRISVAYTLPRVGRNAMHYGDWLFPLIVVVLGLTVTCGL